MPTAEAPDWFTAALAAPRTERVVTVEGCPIHTIRWITPAATCLEPTSWAATCCI